MIDLPLSLRLGAKLTDARLAQLTRNFEHDLSRLGVRSSPATGPLAPGTRGDAVTIGVLALAVVTSGTLKAVIDCFRAYIAREHTLTLTLERADGTSFQMSAQNVDTPVAREALEALVRASGV